MENYKFTSWLVAPKNSMLCHTTVNYTPDDLVICDWVHEADSTDPGETYTIKLENRCKTKIEVYNDVVDGCVLWCKTKDDGCVIKQSKEDDNIRQTILWSLACYDKALLQCIQKQDGPGVEAIVERCCRVVEHAGTEPVPSTTDDGLPSPAVGGERDAQLEVECEKLKKANASLRILVKLYQKTVADDDPCQPILQMATGVLMPDL